MDLLSHLKIIKLKENILRLIPLVTLLINFIFTGILYEEKELLELEYNEAVQQNIKNEEAPQLESKELPYVDVNQVEVLIYIAKGFNYNRVDATVTSAIFEFTEDAFFEARKFEEILEKNKYEYNLQMAEGKGGWNGMRIEVLL